jgi:hypothetical protein
MAYYASPWDLTQNAVMGIFLLSSIAFCLALCFAVYLRIRRKTLTFGTAFFAVAHIVIIAGFNGVGIYAFYFAPNKNPHLVLAPDYVACGPWRASWRSFDDITLGHGLYFRPTLTFLLNRASARQSDWDPWVWNHGWVNCQISALTDDPQRIQFATSADTIYAQVTAAWRDARSR